MTGAGRRSGVRPRGRKYSGCSGNLHGLWFLTCIACKGNRLFVTQRFSQEILAILDIERREDFAGFVSAARIFTIEASREETWDQIRFIFEFEGLLLEPGLITIAEGGETETFDYNHLSAEESERILKSIRFKIPKDYVAGDFDMLLQWFDRPYQNYSIAGIDKLARWNKLREIATNGEFPLERTLSDPIARSDQTSGLFTLSAEYEGKFRWVLQDQQKEDFAALCIYAEEMGMTADIEEDYADIEILFSVEVFCEESTESAPGDFFLGIRMGND